MKFRKNLAHKWLSTKLVKIFDFFYWPSHQIQAQKIHFSADFDLVKSIPYTSDRMILFDWHPPEGETVHRVSLL